MIRRLLLLVAALCAIGASAADAQQSFNQDAYFCSGHPWVDVRCNGALGDDAHDDTSAIQTTINTAVTNGWPVFIPAGTYKVTSLITVDYAGRASSGFVIRSEGATLDGAAVASGPVLQVQCGGGTPAAPTACFYFALEGRLQIKANTPAYAFVMGKPDFSDQHNSWKIEHLNVNNASTNPAAGGCQLNANYDAQLDAVCDASGGAAGLALEQTQFSRISGSATASGTGGRGLVLENGYSFSNTFYALDLEVSPTCLSVTTVHNGYNTWVSPYFNCTTAVSAVASNGNALINPQYAGNVVNFGPQSTGMQVIGYGSRQLWQFPSSATYTAAPIDDGLRVSSYNAPGASLTVNLPNPADLNMGWSMGFASDNGHGIVINAAGGGSILYQGQSLSTITMSNTRYEFLRLENDGNNFRVTQETRNSRLLNGHEPSPWPTNWLFPSTSGYTATLQDDGNVLSSFNTSAGLTVTLPSTTAIPTGWMLGLATDSNKGTTVNVNGTAGGHIIYPGSGASQTTISLANTSQGAYEFAALQYDGSGNFRLVEATPATMQALGVIGSASISHWSFPSPGNGLYSATIADNGNVVSSFNSGQSFLSVTLPSATIALPMGWTIGLASDSGKTMSVQVNGTNGGHILWPGSGATQTSLSLAAGNYEFVRLSYDGSNFRVISATPATSAALGMNPPTGIGRWTFPSAATYSAAAADNGNALSSYNTIAGLTVTLPPTTAIAAPWQMAFVTDNGKPLTVQVNATNGGHILYPAGSSGTSATSITLAGINYELVWLGFDGTNFRLLSETPQTASALKMFGHMNYSGAAPALGSGSGDCGTSASLAGNDSTGRITVGSGTNGGKCTVTFASAWSNPPVCTANDESNAALIRPISPTTTAVAFAGAIAAGDAISYHCTGY